MARSYEIEALTTLTWIRQGSRAVVEEGPGLQALVEKRRVRIVREVDLTKPDAVTGAPPQVGPPAPPTLEEIAAD